MTTSPRSHGGAETPLQTGQSRGADGAISRPDTFRIRLRTAETDGRLSIVEQDASPLQGPPLHIHHGVDEWFYVVAGEFVFEIGGVLRVVGAGGSILGPRDVPHRWANRGHAEGRLLFEFLPEANMEAFFEDLDTGKGGDTREARGMHWAKFGMHILGPPLSPNEIRRA